MRACRAEQQCASGIIIVARRTPVVVCGAGNPPLVLVVKLSDSRSTGDTAYDASGVVAYGDVLPFASEIPLIWPSGRKRSTVPSMVDSA